jgi:hypothetical protein
MLTVDTRAVPSHAPGVFEQQLDDDLLLISDARPEGLSLNPSARAVWELCDGCRTVEDIAHELGVVIDVPASELLPHVQGAVSQLTSARVLEVAASFKNEVPDAVDWARVATPQEDLYDAKSALDLLGSREQGQLATRPTADGAPTLAGGRVGIRYCYGNSIEKGLVDAPLDHPNIALADEYLKRAWPLAHRHFQILIHSFHPAMYPDRPSDDSFFLDSSHCHSAEELPGTMWATVNCPMMLAEAFVHEMAHQKLFGLGVFKESQLRLIENSPDEMYRSPVITTRPRPMSAVVHGVYAYAYVTELDLRMTRTDVGWSATKRGQMVRRLHENAARLEQGLDEIRTHVRTDAAGATFFAGLYRWLDQLVRESSASSRA